ncbi:MAG: hypothetical protein WC483_00575 [Candidatus Paceibacterota bacterium]
MDKLDDSGSVNTRRNEDRVTKKCVTIEEWRREKKTKDDADPAKKAALPTCQKGGIQLPIRSPVSIVKRMPDGALRAVLPEPGTSLFALAHAMPIGGRRWKGPPSLVKPMLRLDKLRVIHASNLLDIIRAYPAIRYADIEKMIPTSLQEHNLLRPWMIEQLNRDRMESKKMWEEGEGRLVDIVDVYEKYCRNRDLPSDYAMEHASCIGMTMTSTAPSIGRATPACVSLFIWPYGQWIYHVDPATDRDSVARTLLLDAWSRAAVAGIPIVHAEKDLRLLIEKMFDHIPDDFSLPSFVKVGDDVRR